MPWFRIKLDEYTPDKVAKNIMQLKMAPRVNVHQKFCAALSVIVQHYPPLSG